MRTEGSLIAAEYFISTIVVFLCVHRIFDESLAKKKNFFNLTANKQTTEMIHFDYYLALPRRHIKCLGYTKYSVIQRKDSYFLWKEQHLLLRGNPLLDFRKTPCTVKKATQQFES